MTFTTTLYRQDAAGKAFEVPLEVEAIITHHGDGWNEPHSTECYILEARLPYDMGGLDVLFGLSLLEVRELEAQALAGADDWQEACAMAAAEEDDDED